MQRQNYPELNNVHNRLPVAHPVWALVNLVLRERKHSSACKS